MIIRLSIRRAKVASNLAIFFKDCQGVSLSNDLSLVGICSKWRDDRFLSLGNQRESRILQSRCSNCRSSLAPGSPPIGLTHDFLHISLVTSLTNLVRNVPVAVPLLCKTLAAPVALVRFLLDVQKDVVEPVAQLGENVAALLARQHLILAPSPSVKDVGFGEHPFGFLCL